MIMRGLSDFGHILSTLSLSRGIDEKVFDPDKTKAGKEHGYGTLDS